MRVIYKICLFPFLCLKRIETCYRSKGRWCTGLGIFLLIVVFFNCDRARLEHPRRIEIEVATYPLQVELALTEEERRRGLMFRKHLATGAGMLFVFPYPREVAFWMKNTLIPLDVAYFSSDKRMLEYMSMFPDDGVKTYPSSGPTLYALETNIGWFAKKKINKGALLHIPSGARITGK